MAQKAAVNQFSDGLISDLNPINTPSNVLTDNLNGTIITYNGNEYSLQNDMGNYKLEYCKLKKNYIPVGIKEYADILYIISYNPLDEHVEIGSYPAPEQIFGNEGDGAKQEIPYLIDWNDGKNYNEYSELIKNSVLYTYYDGDNGDLFLNPDDEYKLSDKEFNNSEIEYLWHYVVDENRRIYDIQKTYENRIEKDGFAKVGWDVPGWMALKVNLANFEEFNVNIRKVAVPIISEAEFSSTINLNFQLNIRDNIFLEDNITNDSQSYLQSNGYILLSITAKTNEETDGTDVFVNRNPDTGEAYDDIEYEGEKYYKIPLSVGRYVEWYPGSKIFSLNLNNIETEKSLNNGSVLTIKAIPAAEVSDPNSSKTKLIVYNNFIFSQDVSLNKIGSIDDLNLGNTLFRFWVDEDSNGDPEYFSIEFNVDGPFTQSSTINLYYAIWDIQNYEVETRVTPYKQVTSFAGIGQNLLQIEFDKSGDWVELWNEFNANYPDQAQTDVVSRPTNEYNPTLYTGSPRFEAESYYMIEFVFAESLDDIERTTTSKGIECDNNDKIKYTSKQENSYTFSKASVHFIKPVITSFVFNNFLSSYRIFNKEISGNTWVKAYLESIKESNTFLFNETKLSSNSVTINNSLKMSEIDRFWNSFITPNDYVGRGIERMMSLKSTLNNIVTQQNNYTYQHKLNIDNSEITKILSLNQDISFYGDMTKIKSWTNLALNFTIPIQLDVIFSEERDYTLNPEGDSFKSYNNYTKLKTFILNSIDYFKYDRGPTLYGNTSSSGAYYYLDFELLLNNNTPIKRQWIRKNTHDDRSNVVIASRLNMNRPFAVWNIGISDYTSGTDIYVADDSGTINFTCPEKDQKMITLLACYTPNNTVQFIDFNQSWTNYNIKVNQSSVQTWVQNNVDENSVVVLDNDYETTVFYTPIENDYRVNNEWTMTIKSEFSTNIKNKTILCDTTLFQWNNQKIEYTSETHFLANFNWNDYQTKIEEYTNNFDSNIVQTSETAFKGDLPIDQFSKFLPPTLYTPNGTYTTFEELIKEGIEKNGNICLNTNNNSIRYQIDRNTAWVKFGTYRNILS